MALTAPTDLATERFPHPREMPRWCAGLLTIAGNIAILGVLVAAVVVPLVAAVLVFGPALLDLF